MSVRVVWGYSIKSHTLKIELFPFNELKLLENYRLISDQRRETHRDDGREGGRSCGVSVFFFLSFEREDNDCWMGSHI